MMSTRKMPGRASARAGRLAGLCIALVVASVAAAQDTPSEAARWLDRVAQAARTLNYTGTVVYQTSGRVETWRLVHQNENGVELEKLTSLDGPAREVIRGASEVRYFHPEAKVVRVEPRTFRNVFPSLSADQVRNLSQYYNFRVVAGERIAGHAAKIVVFEPKDGLRYGHMFWSDAATGLLLKARLLNEKGEVVDQFAFTEVSVFAKIDPDMVKPSFPPAPAGWLVREGSPGDVVTDDTGWAVGRLPPGFAKITEGFRKLRGKREPVAHIVYSDGLVAVSVFIEPMTITQTRIGLSKQGGLNIYAMRNDAYLVTVLGEAPPAMIRQIAQSVARR